MNVTVEQARRWASVFPRHQIGWLLAAAALVALLAKRMPPELSNAAVNSSLAMRQSMMAERSARPHQYAWLSRKSRAAYVPLVERIPDPPGAKRVDAAPGDFADWLRHMPVLAENAAVVDGHGKPAKLPLSTAVAAVVDLHPSNRGLLVGPNMLTRLRAEFLWSTGRMQIARFCFTCGEECPWTRFAAGERPIVDGRDIGWKPAKTEIAKAAPKSKLAAQADAMPESAPTHKRSKAVRAAPDLVAEAMADAAKRMEASNTAPRTTFNLYLESFLPYASAISLDHDTRPASGEPRPGDVFVIPTQSGHAVILLDVAVLPNGDRFALIGEGLRPACSLHVLRDASGSAWFRLDQNSPLRVSTWPTPIPWSKWRRWPAE